MIGKCLLGYLEILSWPFAAHPKILRGMKKERKKERKNMKLISHINYVSIIKKNQS